MNNILEKFQELKRKRGFELNLYLKNKSEKLVHFFQESKIDAVVIGMSGGIDSALVTALMIHIAGLKNSPLKKVSGVLAPIFGEGTSGQEEALNRAKIQCEKWSAKYDFFESNVVNLSSAYQSIIGAHPIKGNAWAEGQMASVLRTPLFYFHAALLQQQGYRSLVCGTTNRDEGSYIGFYGKASDAMVDLQPIADIHKSEVYELAEYFKIIPEIINSTPKGDVWDDRVDEEMIGAPYWFLEFYQLLICSGQKAEFEQVIKGEELELYSSYKDSIEKLQQINYHKYQVGSPAHYVDVMDRTVK
jgi:NAD+ synthetase